MKLLSRTEASSQANQQRKEQADSGIYLAGRVDRLRITLQELETQQSDFIRSNQKAIDDALREGFEKLGRMTRETKALESRMDALRKPLDSEWKLLEEQRTELDTMMALEARKCLITDAKEAKLDNLIDEARKERDEAVSERKRADDMASESREKLDAATRTLSESEEHGRNSKVKAENAARELENERIRLEYDRKHFRDFEKEMRKRERELSDRETRVGIKERKYANRQ